MDGFRFCQELRSNPRFHAIPVIFMSVRSDLADKLAAYEVGADDYLVKPFDMLELSPRLQAVLRRSARQSAMDRERALQLEAQADQGVQSNSNDKPAEGAHLPDDRVLEVHGLRLYLDNALVESELGEARLTPAEFELLKFHAASRPESCPASGCCRRCGSILRASVIRPSILWHVKKLQQKFQTAGPKKS